MGKVVISDLLSRALEESYDFVKYEGKTFKLDKIDGIVLKNIISRHQQAGNKANAWEIDLVVLAIQDVKGLKIKDLLNEESHHKYTPEDLNADIEFDINNQQIHDAVLKYIGKHNDLLALLFKTVYEGASLGQKNKEKKTETLTTELNTSSTSNEKENSEKNPIVSTKTVITTEENQS